MNLSPSITEYTKDIDVKTYESSDLQSQISRGIKYTKEAKGSKLSITITVSLGVGLSTAGGGFLGGLIGLIATASSGPVALVGWKTGMVLGSVFGAICGVPLSIIQIKRSEHYRLWKSSNIKDKVSGVFYDYTKKDRILKDHLCFLSGKIPSLPVRGPDTYLYDRDKIVDDLEKNPTNYSFKEDDLRLDIEVLCKITERFTTLYSIEVENMKDSKVISDGLSAYLIDKLEENDNILAGIEEDSLRKFRKKECTYNEHTTTLKLSQDIFRKAFTIKNVEKNILEEYKYRKFDITQQKLKSILDVLRPLLELT